jgi:NADH-quinone oxidoreductase subunit J
MRVEMFVFLVAGAICLGGALGVVLFRNPVHNALSLVATLFGVAVLFVAQGAYFLAAVQVIVYAGAIVVLILFVIMLLGVDKAESIRAEPLAGQRVAALVVGAAVLALSLTALLAGTQRVTGEPSSVAPLDPAVPDVNRLGEAIFTDYIWAFEITAVLLTVAVVGAVVLARRGGGEPIDLDEFPDGTAMDVLEARRPPAAEAAEATGADGANGSDDGTAGAGGAPDAAGAEPVGVAESSEEVS